MFNSADNMYGSIVKNAFTGVSSENRTDVDTTKTFGQFMCFYPSSCYPILTQKKVFHRGLHEELFWFLDGHNNIKRLLDHDVHIWDGWANKDGDLGPVYGEQWRAREDVQLVRYDDKYFASKTAFLDGLTFTNFDSSLLQGQSPFHRHEIPDVGLLYTRKFDQITNALYRLVNHPDCRRIIVDGWNPSVVPVDGIAPSDQPQIGKQSLPACHTLFQFGSVQTKNRYFRRELHYMKIDVVNGEAYLFDKPTGKTLDELLTDKQTLLFVANAHDAEYGPLPAGRELSLHLHQRSMDLFLGAPFNIASYASLLNIFCARLNMLPAQLSISVGDAHIYDNHVQQLKKQLNNVMYGSPIFCAINIGQHPDLKGLTASNYRIVGYKSNEKIEGSVAI